MTHIIHSTQDLLPNRQIQPQNIALLEAIDEIIGDICLDHREQKLSPDNFIVEREQLKDVWVLFDTSHLAQVLSNLVKNSLDHSQMKFADLRLTFVSARSIILLRCSTGIMAWVSTNP